jgi:plasmid stabilization system protein ParE
MKLPVRLRPAARNDLLDHDAYLAADSPRNADRFPAAAEATLETLSTAPRLGRTWLSDDPRLPGLSYFGPLGQRISHSR